MGKHPFYAEDRKEFENNIMSHEVKYPDTLSHPLRNLIRRLLEIDTPGRLERGDDIIEHEFFASLNMIQVYHKAVDPPFKADYTDEVLTDTNLTDPFTSWVRGILIFFFITSYLL